MTAKSHARRVIVVGGSIAGLFVGAFLRRIGWLVDIYERSSIELIGRGVGIFATHLELFEALDKCGAGTVDIGVIVYKRITFDRKGNVIAEKPQLQIVTSWDRLRQVLLKAIDRQHYHFGYVFERVEQDSSGVHVHFANGRSERADLLVGCDGFRSSVRAHLAPQVEPIYSGYPQAGLELIDLRFLTRGSSSWNTGPCGAHPTTMKSARCAPAARTP